jgi:kinetochore protein Mis13/DSN1
LSVEDYQGITTDFLYRIALPHREVSVADFYKHIADEGLPEPRRMRQLLIWCATRALGDKPSGASNSDDQSARLAGMWILWACIKKMLTGNFTARVIQEELLREFSSNSELSNWFSREELNPPAVIVKKPNPRNVQNTDKIKELEEHIQK